jgi:HAD superfamily hydrolase (TIGR01509 family)
MIKGIIFDLDGVIVDTEFLHYKSYSEILDKYNVKLSEQEYYDFWTRKGKDIRDFIVEKKVDIDSEKIREEKRAIYYDRLKKELRLYEDADKIITKLSKKFSLALVTNSHKRDTSLILRKFGLTKYFKVIITREDIKNKKPDPEGFLLASQKLGIKPRHILVIEDAEKGIIAAHKAGMKSIAIPNKYTKDNNFSLAGEIVESINKVNFELIVLL